MFEINFQLNVIFLQTCILIFLINLNSFKIFFSLLLDHSLVSCHQIKHEGESDLLINFVVLFVVWGFFPNSQVF